MIKDHELEQFILDSGIVSRRDMMEAKQELEDGGASLEEVLLGKGALQEDELRRIQAHILGMPFVNLEDIFIPAETLSLIPEPVSRTRNVVAYKKEGSTVEVALLDPAALDALEFLEKERGLSPRPRLTSTSSIKHALLHYHRFLRDEYGKELREELQMIPEIKGGAAYGKDVLEKAARDPHTRKVLDLLLKSALFHGASHIHLEPKDDDLLVRMRVGGHLHDAMQFIRKAHAPLTARIKMLAGMELDAHRRGQEGRFMAETEAELLRVRASTLPTMSGEKIVLRILRENTEGFTLESLGLSGEGLERLMEAVHKKRGLVLVTGPAGSGVTTTLYTLLDILNSPRLNIATVEDPIEYQIPRINQTQVRPDIGYDMENGVRSILRQDPDVLMASGLDRKEAAELALRASSRLLVLASMESETAAGAIEKLLDMGVDRAHLTSSLKLIVNQRLAKRAETEAGAALNERDIARLKKIADVEKVMHKAVHEGYIAPDTKIEKIHVQKKSSEDVSEIVGIFEALPVSGAIQEYIREDRIAKSMEEEARREGMLTLAEDALMKAIRGIIALDEVFKVAPRG